jgi:TonB-dependent Receptor Plug Domain
MQKGKLGIAAMTSLVLGLATACAHSKPPATGVNPDVITEDDIERIHVRTAYDAVVRLHANMLVRRGQTSLMRTSSPDPNVYLDDVFIGPVGELKGIQASVVASIRVYSAGQSATRFGAGNMGGVIEVYTKH